MLIFLARLETAISHTVIREEAKKKKLLITYENANQECQKAIAPIHETETIIDYLKACRNLGSQTQKIPMLTETMAAAFISGCFICGNKNHLKRDCPKKANKRPPKILPHCCRGMHWAKDCNFNLILKENLFQKTPDSGPPRSHLTITRGKFHLFPQTLNIWQCCH